MTKMIQTPGQAIEAAAEIADKAAGFTASIPYAHASRNIAARIRTLTAHIAAPDEVEADRRKAIAQAIFDPGMVVGMKGDHRTLTDWQTDAVLAALAPTPIPLVDPAREALEKCRDIAQVMLYCTPSARLNGSDHEVVFDCGDPFQFAHQMIDMCDRALGSPAVGDGGESPPCL